MSEYIVDVGDADEEYIEHFGYMATAYADNPIHELIVRCRDCKYFNQRDGIFPPMVCLRWGYYNFKTEPERFCSWGERREQ